MKSDGHFVLLYRVKKFKTPIKMPMTTDEAFRLYIESLNLWDDDRRGGHEDENNSHDSSAESENHQIDDSDKSDDSSSVESFYLEGDEALSSTVIMEAFAHGDNNRKLSFSSSKEVPDEIEYMPDENSIMMTDENAIMISDALRGNISVDVLQFTGFIFSANGSSALMESIPLCKSLRRFSLYGSSMDSVKLASSYWLWLHQKRA